MKSTQALLAFGIFASALAQQRSDSTKITQTLSENLTSNLPTGSSLRSVGTKAATPTTTVTKSGDATVTGTRASHTSTHSTSASSGGAAPTAAAVNMAPLLGVAVALLAA
ncbi:hypothetical protein HRG_008226 [Hirsutella rhossiliensis]|uniref:GPI anchored protein n=1 Tax=Hirsutella rhossiliensis TaxID=111463 RepID=A0A9P8MSC6_9HYPO|nr:uncharacterized protein HRG_08226 [Hirsutella rhossiliensis]KAH0961073.1 hypothetical protein HRG_08226 [Hirsutella rhossiliensis]